MAKDPRNDRGSRNGRIHGNGGLTGNGLVFQLSADPKKWLGITESGRGSQGVPRMAGVPRISRDHMKFQVISGNSIPDMAGDASGNDRGGFWNRQGRFLENGRGFLAMAEDRRKWRGESQERQRFQEMAREQRR